MGSKKSSKRTSGVGPVAIGDLLRVPAEVSMADPDPRATPGFDGGKSDAPAAMAAVGEELSELQERLFAAGRTDPESAPRLLVVLQGMDTSGKGGVIRHTFGLVDPQGIALTSFKAPTEEERAHHYLWRIRKALPGGGMIGLFDRSHYEDVLVARVEELVPQERWEKRYEEINTFEQKLVEGGTRIVKCFLNVSFDKQKERLAERLADPAKYWKYNPADLDARSKWPQYQEAYRAVLERCSTEVAPWYAVPADRKWYRNWAVAQLLLENLRDLDLGWPPADFDVAEEKARLADA